MDTRNPLMILVWLVVFIVILVVLFKLLAYL